MNAELVDVWVKIGILRARQRDVEKVKSMIDSAETNARVAKTIKLNDASATLIFRELYESIRQLGDAAWWICGYEPSNHAISMDALKDLDVTNKLKLNSLDRLKKIRHDINYRGFRTTVQQASEIVEFWDVCGMEIIKLLRNKAEK